MIYRMCSDHGPDQVKARRLMREQVNSCKGCYFCECDCPARQTHLIEGETLKQAGDLLHNMSGKRLSSHWSSIAKGMIAWREHAASV